MKDKKDLMQFRIETELKEKFYSLAEKQGISPSKLLRSLMLQNIKEDEGEIKDLKEQIKSTTTILLDIQKFIQQMALLTPDDRVWKLYRKSFLAEYFRETLSQHLNDSKLEGDRYWEEFYKEVDEAWFTNLRENPPLVASYLQKEFMDEIREKLKG
ncbi:MAG: type II toxin-antitoxin system RelB/DinJ family antitoxin [Spirochaetia bacterium]|nr:type II toxin-antitoxin system RelB/DinJ family antitoxin [Spirochaetia bacterium]